MIKIFSTAIKQNDLNVLNVEITSIFNSTIKGRPFIGKKYKYLITIKQPSLKVETFNLDFLRLENMKNAAE